MHYDDAREAIINPPLAVPVMLGNIISNSAPAQARNQHKKKNGKDWLYVSEYKGECSGL